ncbi:MAG: hypothetical protein JO307_04755 [Bryobacterales bacterium]|nr:hypothetical protein [Bryobacterales bacterium]MBV9399043.1 hypothetical protein [Bryobacterales bacterium]
MRMQTLGLTTLGLVIAAAPVWAHHSMTAMFDDKKSVTLKGAVIAYEWQNPHVFIYVDVDSGGTSTTWAVEMPSRIELKRVGWARDSVKIGDMIAVEANQARDGSKKVEAKSVTLASGKKLTAITTDTVPVPKTAPKATPRWRDGHPRLGNIPGETGYWANPSEPSLLQNTSKVRMNSEGILANLNDSEKVAPFQPWAKGLYEYRQRNLLRDDPMASCLPPGGPRQFQAPYGLQIVEQPERQRVFVMSGGGNRNWRLIWLDGRPLPKPDEGVASYFGNSVGKWDGDTLVVDAIGYNERFWFSNGGLPHTENLKLNEKISRPDSNTLKYEVTIDDPGAYTRPWTSALTLQWVPNQELEEYFCDDNNKDMERQAAK